MADHKGVLPSAPFTTPMPKVKPPKGSLFEVQNEPMATLLTERGVVWPLNGYAPGQYIGQACRSCGKQHMAAKRSYHCLPCALTLSIGAAADHTDRFDQGVAEGRRRATETVVRALGVEVLS